MTFGVPESTKSSSGKDSSSVWTPVKVPLASLESKIHTVTTEVAKLLRTQKIKPLLQRMDNFLEMLFQFCFESASTEFQSEQETNYG